MAELWAPWNRAPKAETLPARALGTRAPQIRALRTQGPRPAGHGWGWASPSSLLPRGDVLLIKAGWTEK